MSVVYYAKYEIDSVSQGKVYNSIEEVPERKIGLVLGCSKYLSNGRKNLYFQQRIDAAKELYFSDKVKFLLVSGDNSTKYYDEPTTMKKDLIALGVPGNKIYCDYAGLSTLDSVVRTKEVFKENQFIVISQGFHVRRAIYLGLAHDIDLIGYAPQGVSGLGSLKTELRECLARGKALLDVKFLNRQPKFLGEPVIIK
ncbi:SanA/YdcF family protein [Candidatus Seribacter sulfatis]|uniref:SanA/YdcF family protein n=1 Tax=Candidatus Seribacter sulfatis TaxID=3381756 RepID=UPI00389A490A